MEFQEENMDIEKMSNIDISQDSVKSISEKCNELKNMFRHPRLGWEPVLPAGHGLNLKTYSR